LVGIAGGCGDNQGETNRDTTTGWEPLGYNKGGTRERGAMGGLGGNEARAKHTPCGEGRPGCWCGGGTWLDQLWGGLATGGALFSKGRGGVGVGQKKNPFPRGVGGKKTQTFPSPGKGGVRFLGGSPGWGACGGCFGGWFCGGAVWGWGVGVGGVGGGGGGVFGGLGVGGFCGSDGGWGWFGRGFVGWGGGGGGDKYQLPTPHQQHIKNPQHIRAFFFSQPKKTKVWGPLCLGGGGPQPLLLNNVGVCRLGCGGLF